MYPSDLSDAEWKKVEGLMPKGKKAGRPRRHSMRVMLNAIFYVQKTGCQWRQMPSNFPPWKSVYNTYWRWRERGVWKDLTHALRQELRIKLGRNEQPSVAIIPNPAVDRSPPLATLHEC